MVQDVRWDAGDTLFFDFENEFVENDIRCIPMIVRFKLDACGVKLKLQEWCMLTAEEKGMLVNMKCKTAAERSDYRCKLQKLILDKTGHEPTALAIEAIPGWANTEVVFEELSVKAKRLGLVISLTKWQQLSNLQRFALVKLSAQSHESKNLPKALAEFGI